MHQPNGHCAVDPGLKLKQQVEAKQGAWADYDCAGAVVALGIAVAESRS
ncbi:hypothetical protein ACT3OH_19060 [Vreelandella zhanjiangensis]